MRTFESIVSFDGIDPEYFPTIDLPVVRGRNFTSTDDARATRVAIVSESLGRALAGEGDPYGYRITQPFTFRGEEAEVMEVVGIVPDIITNVGALKPLEIYVPIAQTSASPRQDLFIRPASDLGAASRATLQAIAAIDPDISIEPLRTIDERLGDQLPVQQFGASVLGGLGAIATLLTALGIYVLADSAASARRREVGIRAALGASRWQICSLVLGEIGWLVGIGLALGLALVWLGSDAIRGLLFQIEPLDFATLAGVAAGFIVLALAVSIRPAVAAMRVDLTRILREE
jgi:ABC-type antimicrobial peptide transport system permease subunit